MADEESTQPTAVAAEEVAVDDAEEAEVRDYNCLWRR